MPSGDFVASQPRPMQVMTYDFWVFDAGATDFAELAIRSAVSVSLV